MFYHTHTAWFIRSIDRKRRARSRSCDERSGGAMRGSREVSCSERKGLVTAAATATSLARGCTRVCVIQPYGWGSRCGRRRGRLCYRRFALIFDEFVFGQNARKQTACDVLEQLIDAWRNTQREKRLERLCVAARKPTNHCSQTLSQTNEK